MVAGRLVLALCLVVALATGCASLVVKDNEALPSGRLAPQGGLTISTEGYRITNLPPSGGDDVLLLLAMSGGGKRSAAFSFGALKGLDEIMVGPPGTERRLSEEIDVITSVSGGSFPAAYWGLHHRETLERFPEEFLYQDIESYIYGIYLLPWRWGWLVDPTVGTNDYMDQVYDDLLFKGATYNDLKHAGRPMILLGATDVSYGAPFIFAQAYFDLICSDLGSFPVSRAVAASNGFPGLFTPVTLVNHSERCGGRKPGWYSAMTPAERKDPFSLLYPQVQAVERYTNPNRTRYIHLMDGGITDNLALRAMVEQMLIMGESSAALRAAGLTRYRRVVLVSLDGQSSQDESVARSRVAGGVFSIFGLVSGAQIDRYNIETLRMVRTEMPIFAESLRQARCSEAATIEGHPCEDVRASFLHISLSSMPPGAEADRLRAIPTGLTISREDVDALVETGRQMVLQSQELRAAVGD